MVNDKPTTLAKQTRAKKEAAKLQKQITDADKKLSRETADLDALKLDLDQCQQFVSELGLDLQTTLVNTTTPSTAPIASSQLSLDFLDPPVSTSNPQDASDTILNTPHTVPASAGPSYTALEDPFFLSHKTLDIPTHFSGGVLMPAYNSRAFLQRPLDKMLQDLEGRLQWPLTIEMDRELHALSEIQSALVSDFPQLNQYAVLVKNVHNTLAVNRLMLDRKTIVQLLMRLVPVTARTSIKIIITSLSHTPAYKKELHKPAHYDTRKKLFLTLPGEVKPDPTANWKNPNKRVSLRAANPSRGHSKPSHTRGHAPRFRTHNRGRARGHRGRGHHHGRASHHKSRSHPQHRSDAHRSRPNRGRLSLCFTCNRPGHQQRDCTQASNRRQNANHTPNTTNTTTT